MSAESYRRRRFTYSFRAWITEDGSNCDRHHERRCVDDRLPCPHLRLWDLNTRPGSRNILRVVRRRYPRYLHVMVGPRYWRILRVGR